MNSFKKILILSIFAVSVAFCMAACNPTSSTGGNHDGADTATAIYEVSVDTKNVNVSASDIKVCIYALDGSEGSIEAKFTGGKATFALSAGKYIATLGGLDESVSFSSALLTETNKKATITLSDSDYDSIRESYKFTFTVALLSDDKQPDEISAQICDDSICMPISFDNGNTADIRLHGGEYSVEVFDSDYQEIYSDLLTIIADTRFYIIRL